MENPLLKELHHTLPLPHTSLACFSPPRFFYVNTCKSHFDFIKSESSLET